MSAVGRWISAWWFEPIPRQRFEIFRRAAYAFIFLDVLVTTAWVARHVDAPTELYQPLFIGRLFHLPVPTSGFVIGVEITLLVAAGVAFTRKLPRLFGTAVFFLYLEWMVIAMSYGKVDHDRFAFLVALAVLPTAFGSRSQGGSDAAGWAFRCIQVAVMLTYFLAAIAKLRFGGLAWLNGATMMWAVLRRGTFLTDPIIDHPLVLKVSQYLIMAFELGSPLLLVRGRIGKAFLVGAVIFHVVTYASVTIIFLPHVFCLLTFLPLERIRLRRSVPAPAPA